MKEIRTEEAVGHVLCHDITQIIKDEKKGVLFKKGHVVKEEDIPALLSVGKEHLFVWEKQEGILHENEGAEILYEICAGRRSSEDQQSCSSWRKQSRRDDDRFQTRGFSGKKGR